MLCYPMNVKVMGKGENTVLFLHGYGGSINSFLPVAENLMKTHKVVLVDFYGFGQSPYPNAILDTYDYAVQLYLKLKQLKIEKLSIVAHSFGGRIALILSSLFDVKIEKLVLVSSAGLKPKRSIIYYYKVYKYKLFKKLSKVGLIKKSYLNTFGSDEYKKLNNLQKQSYVKIVNQNLFYLLKYINASTLIVWGTKDKSTPIYMAKCLNKNILNSGLVLFENGSHFSYLENFSQFCAVLHSFLNN